jgi:hypothetical protein
VERQAADERRCRAGHRQSDEERGEVTRQVHAAPARGGAFTVSPRGR